MKLHGIRVPHKKNTADCAPVRISLPETVTIPMAMHIGKPARAVVQKGDTVKVGQLIGEADGFVSSDIHASVSGTVEKVEERTGFNGMKIPCVTIRSSAAPPSMSRPSCRYRFSELCQGRQNQRCSGAWRSGLSQLCQAACPRSFQGKNRDCQCGRMRALYYLRYPYHGGQRGIRV